MKINPLWQTWIVKAINTHMGTELGLERVPVIFPDQRTIKYENLSQWVEISYFGPFFEGFETDIQGTIQVHYRCFIKNNEGLYDMTKLTGLATSIATRPIKIAEIDRCLSNYGILIMPKGKVEQPTQAVSQVIQIDYAVHLEE